MRTVYRIAASLLLLLPVSLFATASGTLSTEDTLKQLILLVSQYDARVKYLEAENNILKNEMVKAGIKIPLSEYSGALVQIPSTPLIPTAYLTGILAPATVTGTTSAGIVSTVAPVSVSS